MPQDVTHERIADPETEMETASTEISLDASRDVSLTFYCRA